MLVGPGLRLLHAFPIVQDPKSGLRQVQTREERDLIDGVLWSDLGCAPVLFSS